MAVADPLDDILPLREAAGHEVRGERRRRQLRGLDDDLAAGDRRDGNAFADGPASQLRDDVLEIVVLAREA